MVGQGSIFVQTFGVAVVQSRVSSKMEILPDLKYSTKLYQVTVEVILLT